MKDILKYIPVSPDGYPWGTGKECGTPEKAMAYNKKIIYLRYSKQGYYSKANRDRISLEEAVSQSSFVAYNASDEEE